MKYVLALVLTLICTGSMAQCSPTLKEAALADAVSTLYVLDHVPNAHELNPLGVVGAFVAKAVVISLDPPKPTQDLASSIWTGAAANNIALIFQATNPYSLVIGVITGILVYQHKTTC